MISQRNLTEVYSKSSNWDGASIDEHGIGNRPQSEAMMTQFTDASTCNSASMIWYINMSMIWFNKMVDIFYSWNHQMYLLNEVLSYFHSSVLTCSVKVQLKYSSTILGHKNPLPEVRITTLGQLATHNELNKSINRKADCWQTLQSQVTV